MLFNFVEGPYTLDTSRDRRMSGYIRHTSGNAVAKLCTTPWSYDENQANGRLLIRAPDMFSALILARRKFIELNQVQYIGVGSVSEQIENLLTEIDGVKLGHI